MLTLSVKKPSALAFAVAAFTITRTAEYYSPSRFSNTVDASASTLTDQEETNVSRSSGNTVYVAIGSNIGDRIGHLRKAVDELHATEGVLVRRTSRLYESEPMYVEDQDRFANGAIEVCLFENFRACWHNAHNSSKQHYHL